MSDVSIVWVTDSILNRDEISKIKKQLGKCRLDEEPINELTKYTLKCTIKQREKVIPLIEKIRYPYISVHLDVNNYDEYTRMYEAVCKIFGADELVFTPMPYPEKPLYIPIQNGNYIYPLSPIDLDEYIGYVYIGSEPLIIYVLKKLGVSRDYVKIYNKTHFFLTDASIANSVMSELDRLRPNHFVTDELSERNDRLFRELIRMNDSHVVDTLVHRLVVCSPLSYQWFREALIRVSDGQLPMYTFWDSFKINLLVSESSQAKLYYSCYRSYVDMIKLYPLLKKSITELVVNDQLMVYVPLHTLDASHKFSEFISGYLSQLSTMAVSIHSSEVEALYHRWYLTKEYPDLVSLITPAGKAFSVVTNGSVSVPPTPTATIHRTLEFELKTYLEKRCNNLYERSTISELLNTIPINNECLTPEDVTFLTYLSLETLTDSYPKNLENFNLSDDLLHRVKSHRLSLYGIFTYGPIKGLIEHQAPFYTTPLIPSSSIYSKPANKLTIWYIRHYNEDYPLLWQNKLKPDLTKEIKTLWDKGWFLSDWTRATQEVLYEPSISLSRRNLILNYLGFHPSLLHTYLKNENNY